MENIGKFEVIERFADKMDITEIIKCLEKHIEKTEIIGNGNNAFVNTLEYFDQKFGPICVKSIKEFPKFIVNDIHTEADFQKKLFDGGVKTPRYLYLLKDIVSKKEYLVMEQIIGPTIEEAFLNPSVVPLGFNNKEFINKLDSEIKKMHSMGVVHRDLHWGNIMIDQDNDPVIIDFGTATDADHNSENAYLESALKFDETTKTYKSVSGYFRNDKDELHNINTKIAKIGIKVKMYDSLGNEI
ncbi:MAG: protein kinase domain-containing protein [Minisyncoccia bacterium]